MPDEQRPDGPAYDWLYSAGAGERADDSADPEAAQAMNSAGGPSDPEATQTVNSAGSPSDPEATQTMNSAGSADPDGTQAMNGGNDWPRAREPSGSDATAFQQPASGTKPVERQSFGGTFTGPSQQSSQAPRFATPVQPRPAQPSSAQAGSTQPRSGKSSTGPSGAASWQPPPLSRPSAGSRAAPTRPPRRRRNWWVRGVLALLLVWLSFLVAVPIWAWSTLSKVDAEPAGPRPPDAAGTTYLLVGSDSRAGLTKAQEADLGTGAASGQRTDTIILLDVPATGPTLLLSIPRDSYVDIPGHGQNKINAAYSIGGPDLLVHTVERATKVRIDNYIEIGFAGFVDVVDAVGGIQVCPKTSINDRKAGRLHIRKGCQHVDGHTALSYSRSRAFPNGDITRALHQREVIGAVGSQAASWKTLVLPWRYFSLNSAAAKAVQVGEDVSPLDVLRFAWAMGHVGGSNTKRCVVPYSNLGAATSAGSAVLWDEQRANALFAAIRSGDTSSVHCAPQ